MRPRLNLLVVSEDSRLKHGLIHAGQAFHLFDAGTYQEAVDRLDRSFIVLLVLDLNMPEIKSNAVLNHARTHFPNTVVVTLSAHPAEDINRSPLRIIHCAANPHDHNGLLHVIGSELKRMSQGGTLNHVSPHLFAQLLEMEEKSCTLRVFENGTSNGALLVFRSGRLIDARFRQFRAMEAACRILGWEDADIIVQNGGTEIEDKIRTDLQSIIVKSVHMKDEIRGTRRLSGAEQESVPQRLKEFLEKRMNGRDHIDDICYDPNLEEVISDIRVLGNRFSLGRFTLAAVDKGDDRREIIMAGDTPVKIILTPQSPGSSVVQAVAAFTDQK